MASLPTPLALEIGPDGIAKEPAVIAYTQKIIEEEQLQLKRYIKENYSKIRDVEKELENLTLELKLTAGPKKAALELLRKKIELSTERIRLARQKEDQTRKIWEQAAQAVKDEEEIKKKLCEDLNHLVQESATAQFSRLEELKRRLEALNPSRASCDISDVKPVQQNQAAASPEPSAPPPTKSVPGNATNPRDDADKPTPNEATPHPAADAKEKRKNMNLPRAKGSSTILPKARGSSGSGWTGAGFDVDGRR